MSVRSWQSKLTLPTYPVGPDDPNPPFQRQDGSWAIYPYPMRDDLLEGPPTPRDYTALHVENQYLHCIVLPELGGHLYSLYDKVCKREVFYRNQVVKYGLVSIRGAWISGGIEFNFPTGHTYTTVDPVSWDLGEDKLEEMAWVAVGNICRLSRMEWWVRLSLTDGERRLHEQVFLQNRAPYRQRYWFWNNSAVPATEDLHLVYPARKARVGGGIVDYPVTAEGVDVSWYVNHDHADDIFTLGVKEDFFGCHYTDADFGMINASVHQDVRGRKFFTWGTADDGMAWVDLLTDTDGQYVEIQSGRFETQSIWEFLKPYETTTWEEWWMPVHGMGGWVWANEHAALNFEVRSRKIRLGALTAFEVENVAVSLEAKGRIVWSQEIPAHPRKPFATEIPMPPGCDARTDFSLVLTDTDQEAEIIRYDHPPAHTRQPKVAETGEDKLPPQKPEEDCGPEELCLRALDALRQLRRTEARRLYEKALSLDEGFSVAHLGLGLLDFQAGLYPSSREHLDKCLARDSGNAEAWMSLGATLHRLGDVEPALDALFEALRLQGPMGPATFALMKLQTLQGEAPFADEEADEYDDDDAVPVPDLMADNMFGLGKFLPDEPPALDVDPVELFARYARGDVHKWLEAAFEGDPEQAALIMTFAPIHCPQVGTYPMFCYCLAHWFEKLGGETQAQEAREVARKCPPDYCFPSRLEELEVLERAVQAEPTDWKAKYYLGNLLASLGRTSEAMIQWRSAAMIDDSFAVLQRNLGFGCLHWESDPAQAVEHYRQALARNPNDYRYYLDLAGIYEQHGASPPAPLPHALSEAQGTGEGSTAERVEAQLALFRSAPEEIQSKWQIAGRIAELLSRLGRYEEALEILRAHRFFPWEGARSMRGVYVDCLVGRGEAAAAAGDHAAARADFEAATEYPRNLGVGKVARPQDARLFWLAAREAAAVGDDLRHHKHLTAAAEEPHGGPCEADWWKLLALRELNRAQEAAALETALRQWAEGLTKDERTRAQGEDMLGRLGG